MLMRSGRPIAHTTDCSTQSFTAAKDKKTNTTGGQASDTGRDEHKADKQADNADITSQPIPPMIWYLLYPLRG